MGFLAAILTFVGYVLVYASVANHGRFATAPWTGVLADAYEDTIEPGLGGSVDKAAKLGQRALGQAVQP